MNKKNIGTYCRTSARDVQLLIDEDFAERVIPANDSVRLAEQIVEELNLTPLYRAYKRHGRKPATNPSTMLKVILYAGMERIHSSRMIEAACKGKVRKLSGDLRKPERFLKNRPRRDLHAHEGRPYAQQPVEAGIQYPVRKLQVSKKFIRQRAESLKRITSEKGNLLRVNRSIQSEGAFGVIKQNYGFRQFLHRGKKKVFAEVLLLAMAYNVNKYHAKIQQNRTGRQLFGKRSA